MLALSTIGVLVGAGVVAGGLVWALNWPLAPALAFGALIAATDPIAVIAMLREAGVKGRLRLRHRERKPVQRRRRGAAVRADPACPHAERRADAAGDRLAGAADRRRRNRVGAAVGGLAIALAGRTDDHLVETALTAVVAYGSFLIAERIGASGVLATVAAGLVMGNLGVLAPSAAASR